MENSEIVRDCVAYIDDNLDNDLRVSLIAERLNYSVPHLRRVFKQYTGFTIGSYIRIAKAKRAAETLIEGLRVFETAEICGYGTSDNLTHCFDVVYDTPPSSYIGAKNLPLIDIHVPVTVAGYVLRRAEDSEGPGLALWHGHDFSADNPTDFQIASPEGGAEVGVWTEIDGQQCYIFGVTCREDAAIPERMVRCTLPPSLYAMFLIPEAQSTHELSENIRAALEPALARCEDAKKYEQVPGAPVMEYYHGKDTFLCVPIRERKEA